MIIFFHHIPYDCFKKLENAFFSGHSVRYHYQTLFVNNVHGFCQQHGTF